MRQIAGSGYRSSSAFEDPVIAVDLWNTRFTAYTWLAAWGSGQNSSTVRGAGRGAPANPERKGAASVRLAERDEGFGVLRDLLAEGLDGKGGCAVISGPIASGKTELLDTFAEHAERHGALLLSAIGSSVEQELPLGVIHQLFHSRELPPVADPLLRLLGENVQAGAALEHGSERLTQVPSQILQTVCTTLFKLAERKAVVITVDNLEHVDPASVNCLLAVARRLRSTGLVVVFTDCVSVPPAARMLYAELLCRPHCRQISLKPLTRDGVRQVLAEHLDPAAVEQVAEDCYVASGGNPMLISALLKDCYAADAMGGDTAGPTKLVVGDVFRQAIFSYLHRAGEATLPVARYVAMIGDSPSALSLLPRLVGTDAEEARRAVQFLNAAGLLTGTRFRHTATQSAVLGGLSSQERAQMHGRVAQLLRREGESALTVASHILAAGSIDEPWVAQILHETAEQALLTDDVELATRCLNVALDTSDVAQERAMIRADLAFVASRANPAAALEHLGPLTEAMRDGHLAGRRALGVIRLLLWHGRVDVACAALERLSQATHERPHAETETELRLTLIWLAANLPAALDLLPHTVKLVKRTQAGSATVAIDPRLQANTVLAAVMKQGDHESAVRSAEQVLESARIDEITIGAVDSALLALIYADRIDLAQPWCDRLLATVESRGVPMWHAILAAMRSMVAVRQGDLATARRQALAAITDVPVQGWGIDCGVVLASLVVASTESGDFDAADDALNIPVPAEMFSTRGGLHYLHARGHHHLAMHRPQAALADFMTCGELMTDWGMDLPSLVPWRSSAAEALTHLDGSEEAHRLVCDQLARLGQRPSPTRGLSLRILAGITGDLAERNELLREAIELLETSGSGIELARALADLSRARYAVGERRRARIFAQRAWYVAKNCQAYPLCQTLRLATPEAVGRASGAVLRDDSEILTRLTGAERRVAGLAARGDTNREIATKLNITTSTVEQHLTRVYRKLNVRQREDLPMMVPSTYPGAHRLRWRESEATRT